VLAKNSLAKGVDFNELNCFVAADKLFGGVTKAADTAEQIQEFQNHEI